MKTYQFIGVVKKFAMGTEDSNGLLPLAIIPLTGVSPRALNVVSGSSAEIMDIVPGKAYGFTATETEPTDEGYEPVENKQGDIVRQFNFQSLVEIDAVRAMELSLGSSPKIVCKTYEDGLVESVSEGVHQDA